MEQVEGSTVRAIVDWTGVTMTQLYLDPIPTNWFLRKLD